MAALVDRIVTLVEKPDLRRTMGEAARRRAALADPQEAARLSRAPSTAAGWLDPFDAFAHYPTRRISSQTRLTLVEAEPAAAAALLAPGDRAGDGGRPVRRLAFQRARPSISPA